MKKIAYKVKKDKRVKSLKLTVYKDGSLLVKTPFKINPKIIERIILQNSSRIIEKLNYLNSFKGFSKIENSKEDFLKHKEKALKLVKEKITKFNKSYNFKFKRIKIKNQKTRWGSCSKKGNLNFNYRIIFLEEKLADYIIVHELCHLKELNHSSKFWKLVSETIPEYNHFRKKLRKALDIYN